MLVALRRMRVGDAMAVKELTLPVLISIAGALISYGAMGQRVTYAEKTAEKAEAKAEQVVVLEERTKDMKDDIAEIKADVKKLLSK